MPKKQRNRRSRSGPVNRTTTTTAAAAIYHQHRQRLPYSHHAAVRAAQRSISHLVVDLAIARGRKTYGDDCVQYFLGRRQIDSLIRETEAIHGPLTGAERARLYDMVGTVVRCSHDGGKVITIFTNAHFRHRERTGLRRFRRRRSRLPG